MSELKPCRFCGKTAMLARRELLGHHPTMAITSVYVAQCMDTSCEGWKGVARAVEYLAVDAWNAGEPINGTPREPTGTPGEEPRG